MHLCVSFACLAAAIMFSPAPAQAMVCDADHAGVVLYNADLKVMQYCNSTHWVDMGPRILAAGGGGGCTAPALCPNVGDICDDGNAGNNPDPVFAGFMVYNDLAAPTCTPIYTTQSDQGAGIQWKTAAGSDDISTDSTYDGKINHANRAGNIVDFPAFEMCENLTYGGYNDWYLPAIWEMDVLIYNGAALGGAGPFYWSSSEVDANSAWVAIANGPARKGYQNKEDDFFFATPYMAVRCVRRD